MILLGIKEKSTAGGIEITTECRLVQCSFPVSISFPKSKQYNAKVAKAIHFLSYTLLYAVALYVPTEVISPAAQSIVPVPLES